MMEYNLVVKAGRQGKSFHIAYEGVGANGHKYLSSACGSGITMWGGRDNLMVVNREFKKENVTCKKCLKSLEKNGGEK